MEISAGTIPTPGERFTFSVRHDTPGDTEPIDIRASSAGVVIATMQCRSPPCYQMGFDVPPDLKGDDLVVDATTASGRHAQITFPIGKASPRKPVPTH